MNKILRSTFIILLIILFSNTLSYGDDKANKLKFGKVEAIEFDIKPGGKDSSAAAIVLFDVGDVRFSIGRTGRWTYKYKRHKRIKILTKDGYNYANFEIPTYKSTNSEEILSSVSLASYNIDNKKIVQTKAAKDEKFKDNYNANWTINKFTLSNIKPGTIVEIKYEIESEDIYDLRSWYFQQQIPVLYSSLCVLIPEYFNYKFNLQRLVDINLKTSTKPEQFSGMTSSTTTEKGDSYDFSCSSIERTWTAQNVFAFKNEPFITTSDDYISKIDFELLSTKFPHDYFRNYSNTWENITSHLLKNESFGDMLKTNKYSKELISNLTNPSDSALLRVQKIYNHVKKELKWNERKSIYCSKKSLKELFENKSGNSSDINLALVNLLKSAGLSANPVLISTRENGRHPGIPLISKFNYVIAATEINNKIYYLDATDINYSFNCLSREALNHQGLLIDTDKKNAEWKSIEPEHFSKTNITNILTLNEDLQLTGTIYGKKTNYEALQAKNKYKKAVSEEEYIKSLISNKSGLKINSLQCDLESSEDEFMETMNVTINDLVEEAGGLVYFNPLLFYRTKENPFKSDERLFPVDFAIPKEETYKLIFSIPPGYAIEKLPASISFKLADNSALFFYSVFQTDKQISIISRISIGSTIYPAEKFFELKELFKNVVTKQSEPIVLKKI